jgi:glycosyltransferase involved in cell wall biosynthesis
MGGVAVHVMRLAIRRAAFGNFVRVYNESPDPPDPHVLLLPRMSWGRLCLFILGHAPHILHVHSTNLRFRSLLWLWRLRGCVVIVTLHTAEHHEQFGLAGRWLTRLVIWNLRHAHALILVGEGARQGLGSVLGEWPNVRQIHSWITPPLDPSQGTLPSAVQDFVKRGDGPLLVANGALRLRATGDLYGFDLMLAALRLLIEDGHSARLLLYISSISSQTPEEHEQYLLLRAQSEENLLKGHVHWHESLHDEFVPAIAAADIVLRPTLFESFGQTVVEGLALGKPVIASDAAPRQDGVLLYRSGHARSLADTIQAVVEGRLRPPEGIAMLQGAEHELDMLYEELLARKGIPFTRHD